MKRKNLVLVLSLFNCLPVFVAPASAGTFSTNAWAADASSGIVSGQTVWAYHFGVTNNAVVNGVTVPGVGTNGNPSVPGQFTVAGIPFVFLNDGNNLTSLGGNGSAVMARNFIYGGSPGLLGLQGLTPGQTYTVSVYGVGHESPPAMRTSAFSNGTDHLFVDENALGLGNGVRVDYTFTATSATNLITVVPTNANTFHTYGLALRQPFLVTTTSNAGAGSLRQAVLDTATLPGTNTITFAPALSGATITLSSEIVPASSVVIDASSLAGGLTISGGNQGRIFTVNPGQSFAVTNLTLVGGNGVGAFNSGFGGAVDALNASTLILTRCTLSGNTAANAGGLVIGTGASATLLECTLSDNTSTFQSGAIQNQGTLTMTNCTLAGNHCGSYGGAILSAATVALTHCTLADNTAQLGGGLMIFSGSAMLTNCIVANNTATGGGADIWNNGATLIRGGANIIPHITSAGGFTDSGPAPITSNPNLAPLGTYGGPTQTMPPLPGSPAFDAASVIAGLATDQRGSARKSGSAPDIGAVETSQLWVQNTNVLGLDSLSTTIGNAALAGTSPAIVIFVPALSGATITVDGEIGLTTNVTIDASSLPGGITISGNNASRIFTVNNGIAAALTALNLTGGYTEDTGNGGGAILNGGSLTLTRCALYGNQTVGNFNNSPGTGGAIASRGNANSVTLMQCTVFGNSSGGGAVYVSSGALAMTHCTVTSNSAVGSGGGLFGGFSTVTLTDSIIAGNSDSFGSGADFSSLDDLNIQQGTNIIQLYSGFSDTNTGTTPMNANPLLAPFGNYGGPTKTMPPLPGSPAINAAGAANFTIDQRGYPRPVGLRPDIGAVEGIYNAAGPGTITNLTRLGNGSVQFTFTNLTDASFPVLATTNVSVPVTNWTRIGFAIESPVGSGQFPFIDTQASNHAARFYRIQAP